MKEQIKKKKRKEREPTDDAQNKSNGKHN